MNLAKIAISNNRTAIILYIAILGLGLQTYFTIGRLEYPEFTIRNAQIITRYPGRSALQVEQEVTSPLEQSVRQMEEVKKVNSTSKNGVSIISVELLEEYFDLDPIWQRMRNKVAKVKLPDGASNPDFNDEIGTIFPFVYALTSDGYTDKELLDYAEDIRDSLLELDGVGKVEFHGIRNEQIYLEFSSSEIAARDISPLQLIQAIQAQNSIASSGSIEVGDERYNVATLGEFESLDELKELRLAIPGRPSSLLLSDIVNVKRSYQSPDQSLAHHNGARVLCLAVSMVEGSIVTEVGKRIQKKLRQINLDLPLGLEVEQVFFQPEYVDKSIQDFLVNLGQAFSFVALVMFLFAGWRVAFVVAILVPSAVLICFACMPIFNIQLELMSIAALIIALGLLVDNAVVVSEQILVKLSQGISRLEACTSAVKNLTIPLLAASGTTIAAFSPIALSPGSTSEFTFSLFAVVSLTLLASWTLSLTIIPLFCYYMLKPQTSETFVGRGLTKLYTPYEKFLNLALKGRFVVVALILVSTMTAIWAFQFIPNIFFPPNERGQFVIDFELPLGKDILETEKQISQLENWITDTYKDQIRSVSSWVGNGGPRWYLSLSPEPANPNYGFLIVLTQSGDPADIKNYIQKIHDYSQESFPDARVSAKPLENGPPVGAPIQIRLYGKDIHTIYRCRDQISHELRKVSGVYDIRDDWGAWVKQLTIDPDPIRAARLGLTTDGISSFVGLQYQGQTVSQFREDDKSIPIVLRSQTDYREHPEKVKDIPVHTGRESTIPLEQAADIRLEIQPGSILRENTLRMMTIKAEVRGRYSSQALAEIRPLLKTLTKGSSWPKGYYIEYGGEQEESAKAQGEIASVFPISFSVLALILISQFNSLRKFLIIMITIPPMLCGVTPGLIITGSTFGFMTLLGIIALLGIVVNNAILLIDEIDHQIQLGLEKRKAIITAAKSRLRPILLTTVTTIIGLIPLSVSGGGMWSSMANAMMFGLGFSTLLTLILCPVLYDIFFKSPEAPSAAK